MKGHCGQSIIIFEVTTSTNPLMDKSSLWNIGWLGLTKCEFMTAIKSLLCHNEGHWLLDVDLNIYDRLPFLNKHLLDVGLKETLVDINDFFSLQRQKAGLKPGRIKLNIISLSCLIYTLWCVLLALHTEFVLSASLQYFRILSFHCFQTVMNQEQMKTCCLTLVLS